MSIKQIAIISVTILAIVGFTVLSITTFNKMSKLDKQISYENDVLTCNLPGWLEYYDYCNTPPWSGIWRKRVLHGFLIPYLPVKKKSSKYKAYPGAKYKISVQTLTK